MTEYVVVYERDEDGAWGAWLPDLPGVFALGSTRAEVEAMVEEAVTAALEWDREQGKAPPIPVHETGIVRIQIPA